MKKRGIVSIEYKHPMHLFRDDLLDIEKIFKADLKGRDLKLLFDDFESEDISSISINQKSSNNLSFHIYDPYFSLEINKYSSRFYAAEDSLEIRGAIQKIKEIFDKNVSTSNKIRKWIGFAMYILAILSGGLLSLTMISGDTKIVKDTHYLLIFFPFLCLFSWGQLAWPSEPIIEFEDRSTRKTFWEKNRDQIYVGLIIGIPVAILSFLLGLIF